MLSREEHDFHKDLFRSLKHNYLPDIQAVAEQGGMSKVLRFFRLGTKEPFGSLMRFEDVDPSHVRAASQQSPFLGRLLRSLVELLNVVNPVDQKEAVHETLRMIRQLHALGHPVLVHDYGDPEHERFIRKAKREGATVQPADADELREYNYLKSETRGIQFARDHHVLIDGQMVKRGFRSSDGEKNRQFGEGGSMIQVGDRDWLIDRAVKSDPRVARFESLGHRFHVVPSGFHYAPLFSHFFGEPIYNGMSHIDFNLGSIPEKKIIAVCPNYRSKYPEAVAFFREGLGLTVVEVPQEEADRHPAGFLPLGQGRVLVDKGAPLFIRRLEAAGAQVVPTAVPLDTLLAKKSSLHCLFNEL